MITNKVLLRDVADKYAAAILKDADKSCKDKDYDDRLSEMSDSIFTELKLAAMVSK